MRESITTWEQSLRVSDSFELDGRHGRVMARAWRAGAETVLFLAHATGFCKEVWEPVVDRLLHLDLDLGVVTWDSAAHGESDAGERPYDWWDFASDALAVADAVGAGRRLGAGHSMGGASLAMAEISRPGTYDRLVLIEPIIFPPPYVRFDHPLVTGALRRRSAFPSRAAARETFTSKSIFTHWDDRAMDGYVKGGLAEAGSGVRLRCEPKDEADIYRGGSSHGAFARLGEIEAPVLLIAGAESTTHEAAFVEFLREQFTDATATIVPDAGHFLPMERPDHLAGLIHRLVS